MKQIRDDTTMEPMYEGCLPLDVLRELAVYLDAITQRSLADTCHYLHVRGRVPRLPLVLGTPVGTPAGHKARRKSYKTLAFDAPPMIRDEAIATIFTHWIHDDGALFAYYLGRSVHAPEYANMFSTGDHVKSFNIGWLRHTTTPLDIVRLRLLGWAVYANILHEALRRSDARDTFNSLVQVLYKCGLRERVFDNYDYFLTTVAIPECIQRDRFYDIACTVPELMDVKDVGPCVPFNNYNWIMWAFAHSGWRRSQFFNAYDGALKYQPILPRL